VSVFGPSANRFLPGNSRGYAAVMVLTVVLAMFLLGSAALILTTQHRLMAVRHYRQTQAYYIAEAGVNRVLADREWLDTLRIVPDFKTRQEEYDYADTRYYPDPVDGDRMHSFGGGVFTVKVARKQDYVFWNEKNELIRHKVFRIYSTGTCFENTRVLVVTVRVPPDGGPVKRLTWQEKYPLF